MSEDELIAEIRKLRAEHDDLEAILQTMMNLLDEINALADRGDVAGIKAKIKETAWRIGQATGEGLVS